MKSAVIRVFFSDTKPFKIDQKDLKEWILQLIQHYQQRCKRIGIILCSDDELHEMNQSFLNHETLTDIITFPYHEEGKPIDAELYISIDRVKENASQWGLDNWEDELYRVIAHGVLHLVGYDDDTNEAKEEMRRQEDYCLSLRA